MERITYWIIRTNTGYENCNWLAKTRSISGSEFFLLKKSLFTKCVPIIHSSKFESVNHFRWKFNIVQKILNELGSAWQKLKETITFTDKRISPWAIQTKCAWRRINNLKPLFSRKEEIYVSKEVEESALASEGKSCRPETIAAENQYACHDLSVWSSSIPFFFQYVTSGKIYIYSFKE